MKIFIDTLNVEEIHRANNMDVVVGATTNLSLIVKEYKNYAKTLTNQSIEKFWEDYVATFCFGTLARISRNERQQTTRQAGE
mgnify:FL=1